MADQVEELKKQLAEKTAENAKLLAEIATLKEKVAELTEKLKTVTEGLGGAAGAKDLLGKVTGGSDAAEDDESKATEESPEISADAAKDAMGALGAKLGGFGF